MSTIYTDIESPELLCKFEVIIELKLGSTDMSIFLSERNEENAFRLPKLQI
jgi:hypothetical protein